MSRVEGLVLDAVHAEMEGRARGIGCDDSVPGVQCAVFLVRVPLVRDLLSSQRTRRVRPSRRGRRLRPRQRLSPTPDFPLLRRRIARGRRRRECGQGVVTEERAVCEQSLGSGAHPPCVAVRVAKEPHPPQPCEDCFLPSWQEGSGWEVSGAAACS